jgi:Cu-Zn family superoxide dismutase
MLFTALIALAQIPLMGNALYPESIARDPRSGILYVGSNGDGSVQAVENGVARVLQPTETDGRTETLGIKVDARRDRLLLLDGSSVYVYQLKTNTLIKKIPLSSVINVAKPMLNDLVIDKNGNAYITDSLNPMLLKLDGQKLTLSIFKDLSGIIPYGNQNDFPYNLNGIVLSPDEKELISVKTNEGTLWKISTVDRSVTQIKTQETLTKGDGLVRDKNILYVIRNFENKISKVDLTNGTVKTISPADVSIPTSAVLINGPEPHLVIVNSQFRQDPLKLPFTLTVLPASLDGN